MVKKLLVGAMIVALVTLGLAAANAGGPPVKRLCAPPVYWWHCEITTNYVPVAIPAPVYTGWVPVYYPFLPPPPPLPKCLKWVFEELL